MKRYILAIIAIASCAQLWGQDSLNYRITSKRHTQASVQSDGSTTASELINYPYFEGCENSYLLNGEIEELFFDYIYDENEISKSRLNNNEQSISTDYRLIERDSVVTIIADVTITEGDSTLNRTYSLNLHPQSGEWFGISTIYSQFMRLTLDDLEFVSGDRNAYDQGLHEPHYQSTKYEYKYAHYADSGHLYVIFNNLPMSMGGGMILRTREPILNPREQNHVDRFLQENGYKTPHYALFRNHCEYKFRLFTDSHTEDIATPRHTAVDGLTIDIGAQYIKTFPGSAAEITAQEIAEDKSGEWRRMLMLNRLLLNEDSTAFAHFSQNPSEAEYLKLVSLQAEYELDLYTQALLEYGSPDPTIAPPSPKITAEQPSDFVPKGMKIIAQVAMGINRNVLVCAPNSHKSEELLFGAELILVEFDGAGEFISKGRYKAFVENKAGESLGLMEVDRGHDNAIIIIEHIGDDLILETHYTYRSDDGPYGRNGDYVLTQMTLNHNATDPRPSVDIPVSHIYHFGQLDEQWFRDAIQRHTNN